MKRQEVGKDGGENRGGKKDGKRQEVDEGLEEG